MIQIFTEILQNIWDVILTTIFFMVVIAFLALGFIAVIFGPIITAIVLILLVIWVSIKEYRNRDL